MADVQRDKAEPELARILGIKVPLIVVLAEKKMTLAQLLELTAGSVIEFDKNCGQPLLLMASDRVIAEGEAIKVGENFGLRLLNVGSVQQIISHLGATSADS